MVVAGLLPVTSARGAQADAALESAPAPAPAERARAVTPAVADMLEVERRPSVRHTDESAKVSFLPPPGWGLAPATSLNPPGAASSVFEIARFQQRVGDGALYAQPIPLTSGLIQDAGAVISLGLGREGSDLLELDVDTAVSRDEVTVRHGYATFDEETAYEGLVVHTRYFLARDTDRRLVVQVVAPAADWPELRASVLESLASLRAEQTGPHGPALVEPEPAAATGAIAATAERAASAASGTTAAAAQSGPDDDRRKQIIARARSVLGMPYVWGGNTPGVGMDCSAYVSWTWSVGRYTTDSIPAVSHQIRKDELRPGDAMNLTTWADPQRYGHIRIFDAWANEARTLVWVYEQTPPRAIHRVIAYDARYQPIRLNGLATGGAAPLVSAPPPPVHAQPGYGPAAAPRHAIGTRPTGTRPAAPRPVVERAPKAPRPPKTEPAPKTVEAPKYVAPVKAAPAPRPAAAPRAAAPRQEKGSQKAPRKEAPKKGR